MLLLCCNQSSNQYIQFSSFLLWYPKPEISINVVVASCFLYLLHSFFSSYLWEVEWVQFSFMAATSWTGDQSAQTAKIYCESCYYCVVSYWRWSCNRQWESNVFYLGTTRSSPSIVASIDAFFFDLVLIDRLCTFVWSLGITSWLL